MTDRSDLFLALSHDRRLIRHVAVTAHPSAEWTGRQIPEAFPDADVPRPLLHDNDGIYGRDFERLVRAAAIRQVRTPVRSPPCNPSVERVIGTPRRECTDLVIAPGERHLTRILREDVEGYCNPARTHATLGGNSPRPRAREPTPVMDPDAVPVPGGLPHLCVQAA